MRLLLLTHDPQPEVVLTSLPLLRHTVRPGPLDVSSYLDAGIVDAVIVDTRADFGRARELCRMLKDVTARSIPVVAVVNAAVLGAIDADWMVDEILLTDAGPAEIDARLRLLADRRAVTGDDDNATVRLGELLIDEATYTTRVRGRRVLLTYKEFELLRYLARHPGRVFTRQHLLQQVWGYQFFGGTRTVDVHIRRLRAKLGSEHEGLIGTVRNVGYKAVFGPPAGCPGAEADPVSTLLESSLMAAPDPLPTVAAD